MKKIKTRIISAFPACGKTYCYQNLQNDYKGILDSDSSDFSWVKDKDGNNTKERNPDFPNNYIQHKEDWMIRFRNRGNNEDFVNFISENWDNFIDDMDKETYPDRIKLPWFCEDDVYIDDFLLSYIKL